MTLTIATTARTRHSTPSLKAIRQLRVWHRRVSETQKLQSEARRVVPPGGTSVSGTDAALRLHLSALGADPSRL